LNLKVKFLHFDRGHRLFEEFFTLGKKNSQCKGWGAGVCSNGRVLAQLASALGFNPQCYKKIRKQ
jgi:hypothetical protein